MVFTAFFQTRFPHQRMLKSPERQQRSRAMFWLVSCLADLDLGFDWAYWQEVHEMEGEEVPIPARKALLAFSILGTLTWLSLVTDGRLYGWLLETLHFCLYFPGIIFCIVIALLCQDKKSAKFLVDRMAGKGGRRSSLLLSARTKRELFGISTGWLMVLGILMEDLPQVILTAYIELRTASTFSSTALLNVITASYDLLLKFAEAWDERHDFRSGAHHLLSSFPTNKDLKKISKLDEDHIVALFPNLIEVLNLDGDTCLTQKCEKNDSYLSLTALGPGKIAIGHRSNKIKIWELDLDKHELNCIHECNIENADHCTYHGGVTFIAPLKGCDDENELFLVMAGYPGNTGVGVFDVTNNVFLREARVVGIRAALQLGNSARIVTLTRHDVRIWEIETPCLPWLHWDKYPDLNDTEVTFAAPNLNLSAGKFLLPLDEKTIVLGRESGVIELWKLNGDTCSCFGSRSREASTTAMDKSIDSIFIGDETGTVEMWGDAQTKSWSKTFRGHDRPVKSIAILSDTKFASAHEDGRVLVWSIPPNAEEPDTEERDAEDTSIGVSVP